jgi:cell division initiation protein
LRVTPLEVHNHQFGVSFRGYDRDEVRAFLGMISQEFEQVMSENLRLKDQMVELKEQLTESKNREKSIQKAIEAADRIGKEMKEAARRETEVLIAEARARANKMIEQAQGRALSIETQIGDLRSARQRVEHRLRSLLEEHLHALDRTPDTEDEEKIFLLKRPTTA